LPDLETTRISDDEVSLLLTRALRRSAELTTRRRRRTMLSVAIALVLVLGSTFAALRPGPHVDHSKLAARFVSFSLAGRLPSAWRVASTIGTNSAFSLVCPSAATCYASSEFSPSSAVQVTHDRGVTWQSSPLPVTLDEASALSCSTANDCSLIGIDPSGSPVFVRTTDGGSSWTETPGPATLSAGEPAPRTVLAPGAMTTLSCPSAGSCIAVTSASSPDAPAHSFVTGDAGMTWSTTTLETGFVPDALSCPTTSNCTTTGFLRVPPDGVTSPAGAVLYTGDGGTTWSKSDLPVPVGTRSTLSCTSGATCFATFFSGASSDSSVLRSVDGGASWTVIAQLSGQLATGLSCPSQQLCTEGGDVLVQDALKSGTISASTDAGASFLAAVVPSNTLAILSVSCPDTAECFALAIDWDRVPDSPGTFVLLTSDAAQ
jgi:photosystem II stability/assembly factor-like uncharacterized protein